MKNYFVITREDATFVRTKNEPIKVFENAFEAHDYIDKIENPMVYHSVWELVAEKGFDDGVNLKNVFRTFEYEHTYTGEIREITYRIKHIKMN